MVSLFGFTISRKKSSASPRSGYEFDDDDQRHATEAKKLKAEARKLQMEMHLERQKFELEKLRFEQQQMYEEMYGDDEEEEEEEEQGQASPEAMFMPILMKAFMNPGASPATTDTVTHGVPVAAVSQVHLTDAEIQQLISQIPKAARKMAASLGDDTIRKHIVAYQPGLDDDSIQRAISFLKQ